MFEVQKEEGLALEGMKRIAMRTMLFLGSCRAGTFAGSAT